ncbi:MAG: hypothetical protein GF404_07170, partial [candidate division Zixibacteria bacterium]|nr:hypothetical protein [candidate division Zixibacteria bacterium]
MQMLREGNQRYVDNSRIYPNLDRDRIKEVTGGQNPYATVITCSDSRVPVEHIFDAGLGDIFVIRVAGNVCDVDEIGSIEYGIGHLYTPVLVVLGHTSCGAVTAVCTDAEVHGSIPPLVDNIIPAVRSVESENPHLHGKDLVPKAVEANVWRSIEDLLKHSPEACKLVESGYLQVVGAVYHLDDGHVEWMGTHPEQYDILKTALASFNAGGNGSHGSSAEDRYGNSHDSDDYSYSASHGKAEDHSSYTGTGNDYSSNSYDYSSSSARTESKSTNYGSSTDHSSSNNYGGTAASHRSHGSKTEAVGASILDQWWFWVGIIALLVGGFAVFLMKLQDGTIKARINVGAKIVAGFCTVLVLMAITIFISESKLAHLGDSIYTIAEDFIPLTEKISSIEAGA